MNKKLVLAIIALALCAAAAGAQSPGMVRIEGGTFAMGSPASELGRYDGELQHRVTVSSFYMGKYEVTQKEWWDIMGYSPSEFSGDNLPVENVSWYDAVEYCNQRSLREGLTPAYTIDKSRKDPNNRNDAFDGLRWMVIWNRNANGYRLPTEAEWEYACRAGTTTPVSTGNNITTGQANYNGLLYADNNPLYTRGTYRGKTTPVGSFAANAWGLYDMHGNVSEWCWDWGGEYPRGVQTDPTGAGTGQGRVVRGGAWDNPAEFLRSAYRGGYSSGYMSGCRYNYIGFRLARNG
jgi:formylglycine-generating enzyme required for sulfatase activity